MFGFHTHLEEGVSSIWGIGQLESEMTLSPAQAVIDNEMIRYAKRYQRGVGVTPDELALDVTRSVGITGSFLEHGHTLSNFRDELFEPELLFRKRREQWDREGQRRLDQAADKVADELMRRPVDNGLTEDQLSALDAICSRRVKSVRG